MKVKNLLTTLLFATLAQAQPPAMQNGDGIWLRDALFGERDTFDSCLAHQPGQGMYHNHVQPICLRSQLADNVEIIATSRTGNIYSEKTAPWTHSPILGWALDGYPVYGPYSYSDPQNPTSPIKRMKSGYRIRKITQRDSLPDWALAYHAGVPQSLPAAQQGPPVSERFPLGRYIEDNEFVTGLGDLDAFNGRTTVTPEYPTGTYAYFVTINDDGSPAFPYILGLQYYGAASQSTPGAMQNVPTDAADYFNNGGFTGQPSATDPLLKSLQTRNSQTLARAIIGWDPTAGPQTTWPGTQPVGARAPGGGVTTPANADLQRIRTTATSVFLNSNNLPSYVIGPWFAGGMNGGVFMNWAASTNSLAQLPRAPQPATIRRNTGLGTVGVWVNGVAIFNAADGASYRVASNDDLGGGIVVATTVNVSAASLEGGPVTPGSLVTAYAEFEAQLATTTEAALTANWLQSLGGTTVTVVDSAGVSAAAQISYASPKQINYRVPENLASGLATVRITAGGTTVPGAINIMPVYPGLFKTNIGNQAAAQVVRLANGSVIYETADSAVTIGQPAEQATLILYGTGFNGAKQVTATIGGVSVPVAFAGAQGTYPGLDQINIPLPQSLIGRGKVDVIVTAAGKPSNPVNIVVR